ncbi:MAG: cytochrome P460 family protein [Piscinibacter sp.]|uniref:cytochrome P460 family protein n=1 Tax=Piscinibacter sp. TaxID=1903157 RepID=UPI00258F4FA9|nr:cytochrome P460 family protein [Piscinibacter sp.]MCW5666618.1 cytochrome P460 family protein [Piscinibacter sp.]
MTIQAGRMAARAAALAGLGAAAVVFAQATVAPGPNKLKFPEGWNQGVLYATVDRPDTKQYREFYTSPEAVLAARAGKPIPHGTVITLAAYAAKLDAEGKPVKDANGRFVKDKLVAVNSMLKGEGLGADIPEAIRNGDWIYQSFTPDGQVNDKANLTACYQCHLPFAKDDYLTNLAKLAGRFPSQAQAAPAGGANEVAVSGFAFGPGTLKITAGQKVTWVNADDTPHQISVVGSSQRSELMLKGQSASLQFDAAGNIAYICGLHPTMKGSIEVAAKP